MDGWKEGGRDGGREGGRAVGRESVKLDQAHVASMYMSTYSAQ